jgi:hypothetical protein
MVVVYPSDTSVNIFQTTRRNISEDSTHHGLRRENVKSTSDATVPSRANFTGHSQVHEPQLQRTLEEFEYRVDVCRVTNVAYTEYFQINV